MSHRSRRARRRHPHLDRVESAVAGRRCPTCQGRWARHLGASRPGAVTVACASGHVFTAALFQGRVQITAAGDVDEVDLALEALAEAAAL